MLLQIIIKDLREGAEELCGGFVMLAQVKTIDWGYEIVSKILSIVLPLLTAYIIHKLKKNYWEVNKPFFKNILNDLRKWNK
jgi:hypothetical protein